MIESIALLGHLENEKNSSDDISRMIENCYRYNSKKQQQVAGINIDITNNIPAFKDVILFDLRPEHSRKMLYRGGNGTAANPSPSAAKTQNDTLTRKIYAFFNFPAGKSPPVRVGMRGGHCLFSVLPIK